MDTWPGIIFFSALSIIAVAFAVAHAPRKVRGATIVGYVAHGAAAIFIYQSFGLMFPDAILYDSLAQGYANAWTIPGAAEPAVRAGKEGFPMIMAGIYAVFGHDPVPGLVINVTLSTLTIPIAGAIALRIGSCPKLTAWIVALFPSSLLWASVLLRESLVIFLIAVMAYAALRFSTESGKHWVMFILASAALLWVRGTAAILIGGALVLGVQLSRRRVGVGLLAVLAVGILAAGPFSSRIDQILGTYSVEQLNASRDALARASEVSTAFTINGTFSDPISFLLALPQVLPRVLFGPFIWEWSAVGAIFAVDAVLWSALVVATTIGWWKSSDRRRIRVLLLPTVALLVVLAVTSGNYGTMQRMRDQVVVLMAPLAAIAFTPRREQDHDHGASLRSPSSGPKRALSPSLSRRRRMSGVQNGLTTGLVSPTSMSGPASAPNSMGFSPPSVS